MAKIEKTTNVAILMATYNGEKYLQQQIDSIINQSYKYWDLFIHDDGSLDNTINILQQYSANYANIHILTYDNEGIHSAMRNFFSLTDCVDAEYYMFADQDDVWHNDKIEKQLNIIKQLERMHGNLPVLVYSDAIIVDMQLHVLNKSFISYTGNHPEYLTNFHESGVTSFIPGCTMMFNQYAKKCIYRPINFSSMHDMWLMLSVFKAKGIVFGITEPLLDYRQHTSNTVGASEARKKSIIQRIKHPIDTIKLNMERYKILQSIEYGSFIKYLYYKLLYKWRIAIEYKNKQDYTI